MRAYAKNANNTLVLANFVTFSYHYPLIINKVIFKKAL